MSAYIRQCIMECATYPDMTPSSIKRRELIAFLCNRSLIIGTFQAFSGCMLSRKLPDIGQQQLHKSTVQFKTLGGRSVSSMTPYVPSVSLQKPTPTKYSSECFRNLSSSKLTICRSFSPPDYSTDPPSNFATGITNPYAVQALLLEGGENGAGLDECWRNMNQNRAPITLMTTINRNGRMLPGTYVGYLSSVKY